MATRITTFVGSLHAALFLLIAACTAGLATSEAQQGRRVALVIGNSHYAFAVELKNPVNDAHLMSKTLQGVGFEVVEGFDLDKAGMIAALDRFTEAAYDADLAVIYYAGHGLQVEGRNYVVPVDAQLEKAAQLQTRTIPMETMLASLPADPAVNIIILDACRDNPLARSLAAAMPRSRSTAVGTGLAAVQASASGSGSGGLLIAYATDPGAVAYDGNDANSPYTAALARHLGERGVEIQSALTRVRAEVSQKTNGAQRPWHNASLSREIFLGGDPAPVPTAQPVEPAPAAAAAAPAPAPQGEISVLEQTIWEEASRRDSYEHYTYYLEKYPNGKFAELAKLNISILERARAQAGGTAVAAAPAPAVREVVIQPAPVVAAPAPTPEPEPAPAAAQAAMPEPVPVAPPEPGEPPAQVAVAEPTPAPVETVAPKPQVAAPAVEAPRTVAEPADASGTTLVLGDPTPAIEPAAPASSDVGTALTEALLALDTKGYTDLQKRLNAMGYQLGRPDGKLGAKSRAALATWQGANGFAATGYLTLGQQQLLVRQSDPLVAALRPDNPEPNAPAVQKQKPGKQSRQEKPAARQAVQPAAPRAAQKVDPCPPGSIYRACAENGPAKQATRKSSTKSWLPTALKPKKKAKKDQNDCLTDRQGRPGQSVCF